jgi:carotenoid cleavage dioxygenase
MSASAQPDIAANPHLLGPFAPVHKEVAAEDLPVEGKLPTDLTGVYLRNGANPKFTPLGSYTFPLEGDAMIHGVWIEGGRARYRNRWVQTKGLLAEERAGHALFGGLMSPILFDRALLGPDPDPGYPFKLDPFINIVHHGGRYFALTEGLPPYEVNGTLDTIGLYDFAGKIPGMCAHPRIDANSGEMVLFRYWFEPPFLTWAVVDRSGGVSREPTPVEGVDRTFMIHDFALTEHHVVLLIAPAVMDVAAARRGQPLLTWQPELGVRIAVISRAGGPARWIESDDAFFVWHYANAYEDGDDIVMDFPWWRALAAIGVAGEERGAFTRARLKPGSDTLELTHLDDRISEFPRIDDRLIGQPHRYLTISRRSDRHAGLITGEFDELVRYDMQTGTSVSYLGNDVFGEVVFAPRDGGSDPLDGYYLTYATDYSNVDRSWLLIWDASTFPSEPVARVSTPQRVPLGLHGNWISAM